MYGALFRAWTSLHDQSRPLEKIKKYQIERWEANFNGEGSIYEQWPAIAGHTVDAETGEESLGWTGRDRVEMGLDPDTPILHRTGGTFVSFMQQNKDGTVSQSAVEWNFRNTGGGERGGAYPVSHHYGYSTALGTVVPARVLWDINDPDEEEHEEIVERYVDEVLRRYFP